jgi:hypothetical protein
VVGYHIASHLIQSSTIGTPVVEITGFKTRTLTVQRSAVTDYFGFYCNPTVTLALSGTLTNFTGFRCSAITGGTNRYGVDIAAFTTGTPTLCYGVRVGTHSVGTTRRAVIGGNTLESTANDFLCSTAAKGLVVKDAQGTAEYWRIYPSVSGTTVKDATMTVDALGFASFTRAASATGSVILNIQDVGTTAPAT